MIVVVLDLEWNPDTKYKAKVLTNVSWCSKEHIYTENQMCNLNCSHTSIQCYIIHSADVKCHWINTKASISNFWYCNGKVNFVPLKEKPSSYHQIQFSSALHHNISNYKGWLNEEFGTILFTANRQAVLWKSHCAAQIFTESNNQHQIKMILAVIFRQYPPLT